nr:MAG TPA: hypothetical protein [Caudoviricetes sp.]
MRFLSKLISRNSARLAGFFYRHFPYAVCSLFKASDGISKSMAVCGSGNAHA